MHQTKKAKKQIQKKTVRYVSNAVVHLNLNLANLKSTHTHTSELVVTGSSSPIVAGVRDICQVSQPAARAEVCADDLPAPLRKYGRVYAATHSSAVQFRCKGAKVRNMVT